MTKLNVISQFLSGNPVLTLLLIAHFLADFQWQSQKMADLKSSNWTYLIRHLIIVALPLILLSVVIPHSFLVLSLIFLSHVLIDSGKLLLNSRSIRIGYLSKPKLFFLLIKVCISL